MTISTNTYFDTSINENSYNEFPVIRETKYPEIKKDLEILINKYNEFFGKTNLSAKVKIAYLICLEVELKILLDKCLDENLLENVEKCKTSLFIENFLKNIDTQKIALEKILNDDSKNLPELKEPKKIKPKIYDDLTIEEIILNSKNDELHLVYENFSKFFFIYTKNHVLFKSIQSLTENNLKALKGLQARLETTIHKIGSTPNTKIRDDIKTSFISLNKSIQDFFVNIDNVNIISYPSALHSITNDNSKNFFELKKLKIKRSNIIAQSSDPNNKINNNSKKNELKDFRIKPEVVDIDLTIDKILGYSREKMKDELHLVYENFNKFFLIYMENHARFKSIQSCAENNLNALKSLHIRVERTIYKIAIAPDSKILDDLKKLFISLDKSIQDFLDNIENVNIIEESSVKLI